MEAKVSVVRGGANYWLLRRKVYSPYYRAWSELAEVNYPSKAMATAEGKAWLQEKRQQNPATIPAQLRRLPSGEIQLKIPLSAKNVKAQVQAIRKALGRRVKSAVVIGGKGERAHNPKDHPWKPGDHDWKVYVGNSTVYSGNNEKKAFAIYASYVKMSKSDGIWASGQNIELTKDGQRQREYHDPETEGYW